MFSPRCFHSPDAESLRLSLSRLGLANRSPIEDAAQILPRPSRSTSGPSVSSSPCISISIFQSEFQPAVNLRKWLTVRNRDHRYQPAGRGQRQSLHRNASRSPSRNQGNETFPCRSSVFGHRRIATQGTRKLTSQVRQVTLK